MIKLIMILSNQIAYIPRPLRQEIAGINIHATIKSCIQVLGGHSMMRSFNLRRYGQEWRGPSSIAAFIQG